MAVFAYIRVSDVKKQDSSNQRKVISDYASSNNLKIDSWSEFNISGSKSTKSERGITDLISSIKDGDIVLVSDIARLGRENALFTVGTISSIVEKGAQLIFCYTRMTVTAESGNDIAVLLQAVIKAFGAVEEAKERSIKAQVAHKRKRDAGLATGRTKGSKNKKHKLDDHALFIIAELDKGTAKAQILAKLNKKSGKSFSRGTLYNFINDKLSGKGINKEYHNKQ